VKPLNDATGAVVRALSSSFANLGVTLEEIRSRSWASATFTGARHELTLRIAGDGARGAADAFLANLHAAEFKLRGHILADIALLSDERRDDQDWVRLSLDALTVEDC